MMSAGVKFAPGKPPMVPLMPDIDLISDRGEFVRISYNLPLSYLLSPHIDH
jgi:hypothetical protein